MLYLTLPLKCEVWHAIKPGSTHHFYSPLKVSCTKSGRWPLLYYCSFLCVLHFNVESFVFSLIFEIRRGTVLVYPKFMYLVFMLHLLFSWCFVWWLVCFCVCVAFRCCVVVLLLYLMRFAWFWFVTPILFFVHGFMSFEQRYTTVAFIYKNFQM